jgi:5-methylcytosine-specific restriction protein A
MSGWRTDRNGSTTAWRKVRRYVLARDGYVCQIRGPRCAGVATTADHVVAVTFGGSDHPSNLRAACAPCNYGAGAALASRAGRLGALPIEWQ